jgi:hypothetical protein
MKAQLDMDKIAKALGAERRGNVAAKGGHFGAHQLAAEVSVESPRLAHPGDAADFAMEILSEESGELPDPIAARRA